MATKKTKRLIKVKPVSTRGVKLGVKRGSYKKKNKIINETELKEIENVNINITDKNDEVKEEIKEDVFLTSEKNITEVTGDKGSEIISSFSENKSGDSAFESFVNENKTNEEFKEEEFKEIPFDKNTGTINQQQDKQFKVLVNGYMLLAFIDFIVPLFVLKVGGFLYPDLKRIKAKQIRLTVEQKEALKEIADHMAQFIFSKMNPVNAFLFMLAISYGENAMNALSELKEEDKIEKIEDEKSKSNFIRTEIKK